MALMFIQEKVTLEGWADKVTPLFLIGAGSLILVFGSTVTLVAGVGALAYGFYLFVTHRA
jgi:hypothetical protein